MSAVVDCGQHAVVIDNSATDGEVDLYYRYQALRFAPARFLEIIDPFLEWFYRHGGEDPNWGKRPVDQLRIASAVHESRRKNPRPGCESAAEIARFVGNREGRGVSKRGVSERRAEEWVG